MQCNPMMMLDGRAVPMDAFDPGLECAMLLDPASGELEAHTDHGEFRSRARAMFGRPLVADLTRIGVARAQHAGLAADARAALELRQLADFAAAQRRTSAVLDRRHVAPEDVDGLRRLHDEQEIGSLLVYRGPSFEDDWAIFGAGFYPKLSWFRWDARIASVCALGITATVFQDAWFRGAALVIPLASRYRDLGWWSGRIASMIIA